MALEANLVFPRDVPGADSGIGAGPRITPLDQVRGRQAVERVRAVGWLDPPGPAQDARRDVGVGIPAAVGMRVSAGCIRRPRQRTGCGQTAKILEFHHAVRIVTVGTFGVPVAQRGNPEQLALFIEHHDPPHFIGDHLFQGLFEVRVRGNIHHRARHHVFH